MPTEKKKLRIDLDKQEILNLSMAAGELFVAESALLALRKQSCIEQVATAEEIQQIEDTAALLSRLGSNAYKKAQTLIIIGP